MKRAWFGGFWLPADHCNTPWISLYSQLIVLWKWMFGGLCCFFFLLQHLKYFADENKLTVMSGIYWLDSSKLLQTPLWCCFIVQSMLGIHKVWLFGVFLIDCLSALHIVTTWVHRTLSTSLLCQALKHDWSDTDTSDSVSHARLRQTCQ